MKRTSGCGAVLAALLVLAGAPAAAAPTRICAWLAETLGEDDFHQVTLWFEADQDFDGYYMLKGDGLVGDGSRAHSPSKGTFVLHAGKPDSPWKFGTTLTPPGVVDIVAEVHATPKDVFADDEPPLLAAFTFHREVAEDHPAPPADFGARQCATVSPPRD